MKVINKMSEISVRRTKMFEGFTPYEWVISVYNDNGLNYILCGTCPTLLEAVKLAKEIESFPDNGETRIVKETSLGEPCYRVYAPHYN